MIHPIKDYDQYINTTALFFSQEPLLNPIPSNIVLNKVITGWGATWAEINALRHSIILLPHKSQIASKYAKHVNDYIHMVNEGVTVEHLKKFILEREDRHLKFLSTPEGLGKVITALEECGIDAYKNVFLLLDESHKITKDVVYRVNISSFADYFFSFTNKAMISATPFIPSDPRIKEQGFKIIKVVHEREIKKDIRLLCVNNLGAAFKHYLDNYDGEMLFVFFNSLNGIKALIDNNNLMEDCNIYCSDDGVKDFKLKGMENAYSKIDCGKLAMVNFLTSSFFNGLDIDGFEKMPDVLLLTNIRYADHTILDPNTDVYQILGRFRQPDESTETKDRYRTATHIVNNKSSAVVKLESSALSDIGYSYMGYKALSDLQQTTLNESAIAIYEDAKQRLRPYANIINNKGELDHFKLDNYLYECKLKQCYGHPIALPLAYEFSQLFNVVEEHKAFLSDDLVSMSKSMRRYSVENIKWCCKVIIENQFLSDEQQRSANWTELNTRFPLITRADKHLGMDMIQQLGFRKAAIEKALLRHDIENGLNHHGLIDAILRLFKVGLSYQVADVKLKLQKVYDEYNVKKTAKSTDIYTYFNVRAFTGHIELTKKELDQILDDTVVCEIKAVEIDGVNKRSVRMYQIVERRLNPLNRNSSRELPSIPLQ